MTADYLPVLILGAIALVVLAGLQAMRLARKEGHFSTNFVVLFGITLVITIGAVLSFANISETARTATFTLLGAAAGYFAGRKVPADPKKPGGGSTAG